MNRRRFLASCAAALRAAGPARPNFLILLADDLGWRDTACYGNPFIETPHIDSLARQGMRFTAAYSAGPVCSPTRASLQTGRYPARVGINCVTNPLRRPWAALRPPANRWNLPAGVATLPRLLGKAGYRRGLIGKWHLGEDADSTPESIGYQSIPRADGQSLDPAYAPAVARFAAENPRKGVGAQTIQAISFLERSRREPFLCFVNYNLPHLPLTARKQLIAKYTAKAGGGTPAAAPGYAAMVETMDESIGLILNALARLGLEEDTLVWFLSDNGGVIVDYHGLGPAATSNAPLRGEKGTLYEGGIRIPSIVRWPGRVAPGDASAVGTITNDLCPTLVELAGLPPAESDGVSLAGLLDGRPQARERDLFWHYPFYHHSTPASAIRSGQWKLIEFFETGQCELYDLASDPGERKNLAAVLPERARDLHGRLKKWRSSTGAALPTPNPDYDPSRAYLWGKRPAKPWMPAPEGIVDMQRECSVFFDLVPAAACAAK